MWWIYKGIVRTRIVSLWILYFRYEYAGIFEKCAVSSYVNLIFFLQVPHVIHNRKLPYVTSTNLK